MKRVILLLVGLTLAIAPIPTASADEPPPSTPQVKAKSPDMPALSRRERKERMAALEKRYQDFLDLVEPIITRAETDLFLRLESDAQRDAFIDEFWQRREADPRSGHQYFREDYIERYAEAKQKFRNINSDRARIYLTRGRPAEIIDVDTCRYLYPIQIWNYPEKTADLGRPILIFYRPSADYHLWDASAMSGTPRMGLSGPVQARNGFLGALQELLNPEGIQAGVEKVFYPWTETIGGQIAMRDPLVKRCSNGDLILAAVRWNESRQGEIQRVFNPPPIDQESVRTMLRSSVIANPAAPKLEGKLEIRYGGARGTRTITEVSALIPRSQLTPLEIDGVSWYNLDVIGETMKDDRLFERFRYRYDFRTTETAETIPLVFERHLRSGPYTLRVKIVDANSLAELLAERELDVPEPAVSAERKQGESKVEEIFTEAGSGVLRFVPLPHDILTGFQRIETIASGDQISRVDFFLDGTRIMTKRRPPYSLELDLGPVPRVRTIRAIAYDSNDAVVDGDEMRVNVGQDPFRVRIVSPRFQIGLRGSVRVEMAVSVPEGKRLDHIELFLNDQKVGELYESPWVQSVLFPSSGDLAYLRAVAHLKDPAAAPVEDAVLLNSTEPLQQVEVHLVELPTTVLRDGHPLGGLPQKAFTILEEGKEVPIARFEYVENLPLSVGVAIDSSASMREKMARAQDAGRKFFREVLRPDDKAFVVAFDRQPYLATKWTGVLGELTAGLASLRTEESTALHDAVVYSLYQFQGVQGQKALIVISDGKDTSSRFGFDQALEFARRSGVPIYVIGVGISNVQVETRLHLNKLASETGGNAWFIDDATQLEQIYSEIETELRSQYLLGFYQPNEVKSGGDFRNIEVKVEGAEARTISGYYP